MSPRVPGSAGPVPARAVTPDGAVRQVCRALPEETPVAVVCNGTTQAVMMATPDHIPDFAHGFALSEGFIRDLNDIEEFEVVTHDAGLEARFWLVAEREQALAARRRTMAGPVGCGLCGIDSLDQAARSLPAITAPGAAFSASEISEATDALRGQQPLHDATRAVHAAGLLLPGRGIILAREDVGRHNALDKLLGAMLRDGINPGAGAVVMTSRVSLELVQKCAVAGVPILVAVSAPTAAALRAAEAAGLTVAANARGGGFDLYSHPHRLSGEPDDA